MTLDFSSITADDVQSITEEAIATANDLLHQVVADPDPPTFASTLGLVEEAARVVADAYGRGAFMARVHPDVQTREAAVAMEELLTKWGADVIFRRDLFERLSAYSATDEAGTLTGIQHRLLEFWLRDFHRAGHDLTAEDRDELQRLQIRLIELQVQFARNLDAWEDGIEVTSADLEGLSADYVAGLRPGSTPGTSIVSMDYPEYMPFIQQSPRRDLRQAIQHKFWNRAAAENRPLLEEAVRVRWKIAGLLGYDTWADFAMEIKMAKHPKAVEEFYAGLLPGMTDMAQRELEVMRSMLEADAPDERFQAWDLAYYQNERRRREYGIDPDEVAGYLPLGRVIDGMFEVTGEAFGVEYHEVADARAWHPDVTLYEIRDRGAGEPIAYFYADLFPREGKFSHAAAFPLLYRRRREDGSYDNPVAAIVANLTKPTPTQPSLLKHSEAVTLFHEFGHVLHFCLTEVDSIRFSGFDVEWDFVEAPSQIMENWMWEPAVVRRFARHHATDEPIPEDLVKRLVATRNVNAGTHYLNQIFLGELDLALHSGPPDPDLDEVTRRAYRITLLPYHEGTFFPASFGHLMGGYDAGYYGYLWSQVYGDDMFSVFTDDGITSSEVGARYRSEVLARGGSRDAMDHLRAFLGREPSGDAFLARLGI